MSTKKQSRLSKGGVEAKKDFLDPDSRPSFTPSGIRLFLQEVLAEFKKIAWPGKKVTAGLTGFVLVLVIVISLYLGSVDLLLGKLISTVLN
jgi:preprotein translocase subunit SecE